MEKEGSSYPQRFAPVNSRLSLKGATKGKVGIAHASEEVWYLLTGYRVTSRHTSASPLQVSAWIWNHLPFWRFFLFCSPLLSNLRPIDVIRSIVVLLGFSLFSRHFGCFGVWEPKFTICPSWSQMVLLDSKTLRFERMYKSTEQQRDQSEGQMIPFQHIEGPPIKWVRIAYKCGFVWLIFGNPNPETLWNKVSQGLRPWGLKKFGKRFEKVWKVLQKVWKMSVRDFFQTFWDPGASETFSDFFGILGLEGPRDSCSSSHKSLYYTEGRRHVSPDFCGIFQGHFCACLSNVFSPLSPMYTLSLFLAEH